MVKSECAVHGRRFTPGPRKYHVTERNCEQLGVTLAAVGEPVCQKCYCEKLYPNDELNKKVPSTGGYWRLLKATPHQYCPNTVLHTSSILHRVWLGLDR